MNGYVKVFDMVSLQFAILLLKLEHDNEMLQAAADDSPPPAVLMPASA